MIRLVNGEPAPLALGSWALHGYTAFTVLRVESGLPVLLERHLERLRRHAGAIGLAWPGDEAIEADLRRLVTLGPRLLARLAVGDGARLAEARPLVPPSAADYDAGVNAVFTGIRVHPDLGRWKTGNFLPCRLAMEAARREGAFEGLLVDSEGHVVDGSRTSPLLYRNGVLTVLEGGLEGITREEVADEAARMGLEVRRAPMKREALDGQLLLAGTGVGLVPVGLPIEEPLRSLIARFRLDR
ncbi:aminotransferase class IV [Vulgatibacter incomptus]|uniref:Aminodeoxychorismate lyase n=1 Tax=Vulgatibacter incomptus TaxID=1391653 RepID=A0A0K1PAV9_9BACT|nr:aminotransferase class IV [Vulgatibacter incomptus]AKU90551.1 Aminodeoxychorismate lyase [Vulgatibacter incomptus]